jgi:lipopolysaccharide export LptBFGC system permease protein LptF
MKGEGRTEKAGALLFSYHARWAIVASPVVFALFALGLIAVHLNYVSTMASGFAACALYVCYFFELGLLVRSSTFTHEWFAFSLAWLPNLLIVITSTALLSPPHDQQLRNYA